MATRKTASAKGVEQLSRFALVGAAATGTHYAVAFVVMLELAPLIANIVGYCSAVGISFFGHKYFTFDDHGDPAVDRQFLRFLGVSLSALALSQATLFISMIVGLAETLALAFAVLIAPPYTFVLCRFWIFQSKGR